MRVDAPHPATFHPPSCIPDILMLTGVSLASWLLPPIVKLDPAGYKSDVCPALKQRKKLVSATETSLASWMGALTRLKQGPGVTLHHMWCTGGRKHMVAGFILGGMGGLGTRGWGSGGWGDFASYTGVHFPALLNRERSRGACP